VWSSPPLFNPRVRFVCPTFELFHVYKKSLEVIWREPSLFFTFFAPLEHCFYPESGVRSGVHLKQIEIIFTASALIYNEFEEKLEQLVAIAQGPALTHLRNIRYFFEFALPVVTYLKEFETYFFF
jgi:hypothetical protein